MRRHMILDSVTIWHQIWSHRTPDDFVGYRMVRPVRFLSSVFIILACVYVSLKWIHYSAPKTQNGEPVLGLVVGMPERSVDMGM